MIIFPEHKDGMLEIVATPVTLIGQSGMATSLMDVKNLSGNLILQSVRPCFILYCVYLFDNEIFSHII